MKIEIETPFSVGEVVDTFNGRATIIKIKLDEKYQSSLKYLIEFEDEERKWYDGVLLSKLGGK